MYNDPNNEPLNFNNPSSAARMSAPQAALSEAAALNRLLEVVQEDRTNVEKTMPILPQVATLDGQILVNFTVPFRFNSIVLCVVGGIVAVTHGDVPPRTYGPNQEGIADASAPYNWLFGANGITPGSNAGANAQPLQLFTGPQEIRFREREAGQKVTLWVHPESHLALRAAIDPTYALLTCVGAVEYLK